MEPEAELEHVHAASTGSEEEDDEPDDDDESDESEPDDAESVPVEPLVDTLPLGRI